MTEATFLARQERFPLVPSTNDVVRGWLAEGTPEVCLAVADEQSAGRGRAGRTWRAPAGRALLLSLGFRPTWLAPEHAWRLAAVASLAMADAAEEVAGLRDGAVRLRWPNDLVLAPDEEAIDAAAAATGGAGEAAGPGGGPLGAPKVAGVLGETEGLGTGDPRVVVGIGVNADWPANEFPAELADAMTSLREASGGRPIDLELLLDAFLARLEPRVAALRDGRFDGAGWLARQLTNGHLVRLDRPGGGSEVLRAVGVDPASGALLVADAAAPRGERAVFSGEVQRLRVADAEATEVADAADAAAEPPSVRQRAGV